MLILASGSPRRSELLSMITQDFTVIPSNEEENIKEGSPEFIVKQLAYLKAKHVLKKHSEDIVIGADTIVYKNGKVLGKPKDEGDAKKMLLSLSGEEHEVYTGVAIISKDKKVIFSKKTTVEFYKITVDEIEKYVKSGEPFDKAGAYGIQEKGAFFVKKIKGDFYNVMGLPIAKLYKELKNCNIV